MTSLPETMERIGSVHQHRNALTNLCRVKDAFDPVAELV
jgi:hypothetical protein